MNHRIANLLIILTVVINAACSSNNKETERRQEEVRGETGLVDSVRAKQFAKTIEEEMKKGNGAYLNDAISYAKLADVTLLQFDINPSTAGQLKSGFKIGLRQSRFGESLAGDPANGDSFILIRCYENDGVQHVVFRASNDAGLNYLDFYLTEEAGEVKIYDMFLYTTGEKISETMSALVAHMMDAQPSLFKNIKIDDKKLDNLKRLLEVKDVFQNQQNPQKAYAMIEEYLRDTQDSTKLPMLYKIFISGELDDFTEYKKSIDEYAKLFPNEKNTGLIMMDGYILAEEYDNALESVEQLDQALEGDPYLDFIRGNIYLLDEQPEVAIELYEKCFEHVKQESDYYYNRALAYASVGKNSQAVEDFTLLVDDFDISKYQLQLVLEEDETVQTFLNSNEYKSWVE